MATLYKLETVNVEHRLSRWVQRIFDFRDFGILAVAVALDTVTVL
jgi:hypothetical protein